MTDPPRKLLASQVDLVLQRAAEIDARGEAVSVEELSRVAAEAGIDPAATEAAIAEILAEEGSPSLPAAPAAPEAPPAKRRSWSPLRLLTGGAVGAMLGFVTWGIDSEGMYLPALAIVILYLLLRAVQAMKRDDQIDFQLQNFALWLGVFVTAAAAGGLFTVVDRIEDIVPPIIMMWLGGLVAGGLLVHLGAREQDPAEGSFPAAPAARG